MPIRYKHYISSKRSRKQAWNRRFVTGWAGGNHGQKPPASPAFCENRRFSAGKKPVGASSKPDSKYSYFTYFHTLRTVVPAYILNRSPLRTSHDMFFYQNAAVISYLLRRESRTNLTMVEIRSGATLPGRRFFEARFRYRLPPGDAAVPPNPPNIKDIRFSPPVFDVFPIFTTKPPNFSQK